MSNAAERNKARRERELEDLLKVLSSPEGRRFVWRILSAAGIFRSSFAPDDRGTSFREGQRDIGLMVLEDVMLRKPERFVQMQQEHVAEQKQIKDLEQQDAEARKKELEA